MHFCVTTGNCFKKGVMNEYVLLLRLRKQTEKMNIYIRKVIKDDNRKLKIPGRELTVSFFACSQKVYTPVLQVGSELLL